MRKLYEVECYHQKLAPILDAQFAEEKAAIEREISALQQQLYGINAQNEFRAAKVNTDTILKRSIEDILQEIEDTLNAKMKEFNDSLFTTKKPSLYVYINKYNIWKAMGHEGIKQNEDEL